MQQKRNASFIAKIKTASSALVHDTPAIAKEFCLFYQHLYHVQHTTANRDTRIKLIQDYFTQANLPTLPSDTLATLEGEFTASEVGIALRAMANGKVPGPDGFTVAYYRSFAEVLLLRLTYYANAISAGGALRPETRHAHITVIPKPGKDSSTCGSYHPISLLNIDAKLYAKVIANRLLPLILQWVSRDQTGFIPGREAHKSLRTLSLMAYALGSSQPTLLLSMDAEKAFDISWQRCLIWVLVRPSYTKFQPFITSTRPNCVSMAP